MEVKDTDVEVKDVEVRVEDMALEVADMPAHLRCHQTIHAGRTVQTTKMLPKAETVLWERPYAHSIHYPYRSSTCDECFSFGAHDLLHPCASNCGTYYCSVACSAKAYPRHQHACDSRKQIYRAKKWNKQLSNSLSLLTSISSNPTPIGSLLQMMKDSTVATKRRHDIAETTFRSLDRRVFLDEGHGVYAKALNTTKLNAIGMYNEYGDEIAIFLSPVLAMVNHSCLPNCQQITVGGACQLIALRNIEVGEELSYSYVSLSGKMEDRKHDILKNWNFCCSCRRCLGHFDCRAFDTDHVCFCGAVCLTVDRTTGECVCNEPTVGSSINH
mmetsp:Transcript_8950/g.18320  ORF Transcript_8950/g.18320 Transcript_8950/m.18320 type:complete len:328 (+) Transcript_8950:63-1046(+)